MQEQEGDLFRLENAEVEKSIIYELPTNNLRFNQQQNKKKYTMKQ